MSAEVAAVLLIVVPIAFNAACFELGRAFDYPNILRKEPDEILRRFASGGPGLLLRWPFAVPEHAPRYVSAEGPDAAAMRRTIEVVFATLHRRHGVGIGEHLGCLLTGPWTLLVAAPILSTAVLREARRPLSERAGLRPG